MSKLDPYQKFGIFTLLVGLFFGLVVTHGPERILFFGLVIYSFILFLHKKLEYKKQIEPSHLIRKFATGVVISGLFMETLAYLSNVERIQAGEKVPLFATSSLGADLSLGFFYYLTFALVFSWLVKKYNFTTKTLGLTIFFGQALTVDAFGHTLGLLGGNIPGFILAGLLMLPTLHTSMLIYGNSLQGALPARQKTWKMYPLALLMQLIPIVIVFTVTFIKIVILGIK